MGFDSDVSLCSGGEDRPCPSHLSYSPDVFLPSTLPTQTFSCPLHYPQMKELCLKWGYNNDSVLLKWCIVYIEGISSIRAVHCLCTIHVFSLYKSTCIKAKDCLNFSHCSWKLGNPWLYGWRWQWMWDSSKPRWSALQALFQAVYRNWYKVAKIHETFFCILAL